MEKLQNPLPRNPNIFDPNHMNYADRCRFYDLTTSSFTYPIEVIKHYAQRYGVELKDVSIRPNGLIYIS